MHELTERDIRTLATAYLDFTKRRDRDGPEKGQGRARMFATLITEFGGDLDRKRCKALHDGRVRIPNGERDYFESKIYWSKCGGEMSVGFAMRNEKFYDALVYECYPINTDRGFCYYCMPNNLVHMLRKKTHNLKPPGNNRAVIVKDHAVRRFMERSPIAGYEGSLCNILKFIYVGDVEERRRYLIEPMNDALPDLVATNVIYNTYSVGKIAGTRLTLGRGSSLSHLTVVNTFLAEEMQ